MTGRTAVKRFIRYYRKKGAWKTALRVIEEPYRVLFKTKAVIIYAELSEVNEAAPKLPPGITIDCIGTYEHAIQPELQKVVTYWQQEDMIDKIKELFELGATLWVLKLNGDVTTISWSLVGKSRSPTPLPLTAHDVYIFDNYTFEEYRGRGYNPMLANYRLHRLKLQGARRAMADIYTWNESSMKILDKTCWRKCCEARRFRFFGRNITVWS